MNLLTRKDIAHVMECVLSDFTVRKAIKYIKPGFVLKATRQFKPRRNATSHTVIVTFGNPNFRERQFVKACLKAGEPFPVKKIQLKFYR